MREAAEETLEPGGRVRLHAREVDRRRGPEHRGGAHLAERGHAGAAGAGAQVETGRAALRVQYREQ